MSLSQETKQQCRKLLLEMRRDILEQIRDQHQLLNGRDFSGDLGDCTTSAMAAEYSYMLCDRLRERLWLIDEALDGIESGGYGLCEECEEPINEKRLLLMPFTRSCAGCQSEIERQAKIRGQLAV